MQALVQKAIGVGKGLMNRTPFIQELNPTIDNWDFIKLNKGSVQQRNNLLSEESHRYHYFKLRFTADGEGNFGQE